MHRRRSVSLYLSSFHHSWSINNRICWTNCSTKKVLHSSNGQMVRSGCIASGTTFMTKLEQYYPSQRRVILACFNSKATTGDNHFSDTENNDSVTRKKQQHDCQVEWTDNEKRMRRDAYDILMASIKAVDPYVAVHKRLKCVVRTCSDCDANYAVGNDDQRRQEVNSQKQNADINGGIDSSSCHMNGTKSKGNDQKSVSMLLIESDENQIAPQQENGQFPRHQHFYNAVDYDMVQVIAFGKASYAMANATCEIVKEVMPDARMSGIVIIKDDHATQDEIQKLRDTYNVIVRAAGHPIPDERSAVAAQDVMKMVMKATERTLIICCISGGGSALLCLPRPPITIDDLARTSSILLESGMDITKINVIRKRLELIKGGRLAAAAFPATLVTLVLSDVIGDRLDLIASGPTVLDDGSTWEDAALLLHSYGLMSKSSENSRSNDSSKEVGCEDRGAKSKKCFLPRSVIDVINRGLFGELDDSPRGSHPIFSTKRRVSGRKPSTAKLCEVFLVGSTRLAVLAAAREAERFGYNAVVLGTRIQGEASDVAGIFAALAEQLLSQSDGLHSVAQLPAALLAGGETTVTILDGEENGTGGRNQEVGLSAALHLKSMSLRDVVIASVGTDGTDGPTDAAGAIVDGTTIDRVENANDTTVTGEAALKRHDAYTFLQSEKFMQSTNYVPSLVRTGPTGTNVADVAVILVR